ncbi:transcriptional regulator domain-containing protein [Sphingobium chlorophenolicum]|uniref:transcriptional regulator domain-containing protein n=1 Tax=Sphingobium chlorophenolicum TaxID=46429 RepID=UPI00349F50C9
MRGPLVQDRPCHGRSSSFRMKGTMLMKATPYPPLTRRPLPGAGALSDPRALAWEIVRRRADYRATPAKVERIGGKAAIELVRPADRPNRWGLRFRRRS